MPGFVTDNQCMESMVVEVTVEPAIERRYVASTLLQLTTKMPHEQPVLDTPVAKKVGTPMQLQLPTSLVPNSKQAAKTVLRCCIPSSVPGSICIYCLAAGTHVLVLGGSWVPPDAGQRKPNTAEAAWPAAPGAWLRLLLYSIKWPAKLLQDTVGTCEHRSPSEVVTLQSLPAGCCCFWSMLSAVPARRPWTRRYTRLEAVVPLQVAVPSGACQSFLLGQPLTEMRMHGCVLDGLSLNGQQVAVKLGPALPDRHMAEALCLRMERWVQVSRLQPARSQALLTVPISSQLCHWQSADNNLAGCHSIVCLLEGEVCTLRSPPASDKLSVLPDCT